MPTSPALRPVHTGALIACAVIFTACNRGGDPAAPTAPPPDAETLALVDAVGDRAALTAVVRPSGLPALQQALAPMLTAAGPDAAPVAEFLSTADGAAKMLLGGVAAGFDPSRPIVLALFEPATEGPPGAVVEGLPISGVAAAFVGPGMRHRALVPATDAPGLAAAIVGRLKQTGFSGDGTLTDSSGRHVQVTAEDERVRIELVTGGQVPVDWTAPAATATRTPALYALADAEKPPVAVLVRGWRLRAAFSEHGRQQVAGALAVVASDMAPMLMAKGWSILLGGEAMMTAEGAEFDDWAFTLRTAPGGLEVRSVASLTPDGAKAFARGGHHAPLKLKIEPPMAFTMTADLRAIVEAARQPTIFSQAKRPRHVAQAFQECGPGCALHAAVRRPLGTLKGLLGLAAQQDVPLSTADARAAQIVLVDLAGQIPKVAAAWQMPASADLGPLRKALADAPAEMRPELFTETVGDGTAVLLGVGVDPRTVFDTTVDENTDFVRAHLDPSKLTLPPMPDSELKAMLAAFGGLQSRTLVRGRVLTSALRIGIGQPATAPEPVVPAAAEWSSPIGQPADAAAAACMARAVRGISQAFDAIASAAPDMRGRLFDAALTEVEPDLKCAEGAADQAEAVKSLRRMAVFTIVAAEDDPFDPAPSLRRLTPLCDAGDAVACAEKTRIEKRPRVELVAAPTTACRDIGRASRPTGPTLVITRDGPVLADGPLPKNRVEALDALRVIGIAGQRLRVGIAPDVPWSIVRPVLEVVAEAGVGTTFVVRGPDGMSGLRVDGLAPARVPAGGEGIKPADNRFEALLGNVEADDTLPITVTITAATLRINGALLDPGPPAAQLKQLRARFPDAEFAFTPAMDVRWDRIVAVTGAECGPSRLAARRTGATPRRFDAETAQRIARDANRLGFIAEMGRNRPTPDGPTGIGGLIGTQRGNAGIGRGGPGGGVAAPLGGPSGQVRADVGAAETGALDKTVLRRIMRRQMPRYRSCYERALARQPKLAGKVVLEIVFAPTGRVEKAGVANDTLGEKSVTECMLAATRRVRVPTTEKSTTVRWPVVFAPGR